MKIALPNALQSSLEITLEIALKKPCGSQS
jgi:hypothetical protein